MKRDGAGQYGRFITVQIDVLACFGFEAEFWSSVDTGTSKTNFVEGADLHRRPRYLFVINEIGFIYSHFWELARAIRDAGWEVVIASAAASNPERALRAGMKFHRIQPTYGIGNPASELKSFFELRRAIRAIRPDVIHTVSLKNVLLGGILTRTERAPALLSDITGLGTMFVEDRGLYRLLRPFVLRGFRYIHFHKKSVMAFENPDDRQYFVDKSVIKPGCAFLIPGSGLDPDAITPGPRQSGVPILLCVARMIRSKGILELIEAARLLRTEGLRFELHLAGDVDSGNPTSLTTEQLRQVQSDGVANWLGRRSDVPALLRTASIFCLPTYYREGTPRCLIEAAAAGLPIVTSDVPGCREVVADGVNGRLAPPRNVSKLADALRALLCNPEASKQMGVESRRRFEQFYTTAAVLAAFNKCYTALGIPLQVHDGQI